MVEYWGGTADADTTLLSESSSDKSQQVARNHLSFHVC